MTWWLSFAGEVDGVDQHLGAVFVDDAETFEAAYFQATALGLNPGGEVQGMPIELAEVPPEHRAAWLSLPRLTVLSKNDLRVLGPLVNTDGEER